MKIVADESVDYGIIEALRINGFEVNAIEDTRKGSTDEDVLEISLQEHSILVTEDKDFGELVYRLKKAHIGIVLIRLPGLDLESKIEIVLKSLKENFERMKNSLSVISSTLTRIRSS